MVQPERFSRASKLCRSPAAALTLLSPHTLDQLPFGMSLASCVGHDRLLALEASSLLAAPCPATVESPRHPIIALDAPRCCAAKATVQFGRFEPVKL